MGAPRRINLEGKIFTLDREGGRSVYGESLIQVDDNHYREWIPWRSKLGALMTKKEVTLPEGDVLYLGAAQGTTVSHMSDILEEGTVYAVEFSKTAFRKLSDLSRRRDNIVPILADAFHPEQYQVIVPRVSMVYQDVSQKDQLGLLLINAEKFLKKGGIVYLMLKARSVDVTARPLDIYQKAASLLKDNGFVVEYIEDLSPFQKDHAAIKVKSIT